MSPTLPPGLVPGPTGAQSLASFLLFATAPCFRLQTELRCSTAKEFYHFRIKLNLQRIYGNENRKSKAKQPFIPTITSCPLSLFSTRCPTHDESQVSVLILRSDSSAEAEERGGKAWKSQPPLCSCDGTVASRFHRERGLERVR